VRNPIDRIISSYIHAYERGYTTSSIEEALIENRLFIDITRYYTQIDPYIKKFGRSKVLMIDFEDLNKQRKRTLQTVSEFLGIEFEEFRNYENVHSNESIGDHKRHYRLDPLVLRLKKLRELLPPSWSQCLMPMWKMVANNSKRAFVEKPKLPAAYKRMILNMLDLEIDELRKLMNKDLSCWKLTE
jgi:hypothetical protein